MLLTSKKCRALSASGVVGIGAVLALAGCSSDSASSGNASATPTASASAVESHSAVPTGGVPAPPSGSRETGSEINGEASYKAYATSATPASVIAHYSAAMKAENWKVTSEGGGGGGWGQWGGSGSGVEGNNGTTFVAVNAGGEQDSTTNFEVCTGPSAASVDNCQGQNHASSKSS